MQVLNGFVKIHRKLMQWGWYKNDCIKSVFIHLLLTANFKEMIWEGRTIKKGQLITSYKHLANDLGYGVQKVRTALNKLKSTGEITLETTNKYTIITIANWEDYQIIPEEVTQDITQSLTNKKHSNNNQITFKKHSNNNNVRSNKNYKNEKKKDFTPSTPKLPEGISSLEELEKKKAELRR